MNLLQHIIWNVSPEIFSLGPISVRWYGLFFAIAFLIGISIMKRTYQDSKKNIEDLEVMLVYMIVAVVLGARLGHVLFYDFNYYFIEHPSEILMIWKGGLASHGAAIGILTALFIYSRSRPDQPYLWVLDRIVITVALAGFFIRMGNLMNSEMLGTPSDFALAFKFMHEDVIRYHGIEFAETPRHPSQLYEAIFYLFSFGILLATYFKFKEKLPMGRIFGLFLILIFGFRFVIEFWKENQEPFETAMRESIGLNMGQVLSTPLVIAGVIILIRSFINPIVPEINETVPPSKVK
jgi:prolipoprotein diacylglyceryl transferase